MPIQLQRTFGEFTEPQDKDKNVDWFEYFSLKGGRLTWINLHQRHVAVVLGEAGIGKTVGFELEVDRLVAAGKPACFVALNQLSHADHWELALGGATACFAAWQSSAEVGYFHLDSVDQARLQSHADLIRALWIVRRSLEPHLARVRIAVSSRVSDWTVPAVAEAVHAHLLLPINAAVAAMTAQASAPAFDENSDPVVQSDAADELLVATLDELSREEAERCARHFNLEDEKGFWDAVEQGDYDAMASRPMDLSWMVKLWNLQRAFGTYAQLSEVNIRERLLGINPHYN